MAAQDYKVYHRINSRTIVGVDVPSVVMANAKLPTYGKIVNVNLSVESVRQGQILEANKKMAMVQMLRGNQQYRQQEVSHRVHWRHFEDAHLQ